MTESQKKLVEENLNLVHYVTKSFINNSNSEEYKELFQEGCIGLIIASQRFKPELNFKFSTFASSYIKGYIQRFRYSNHLVKYSRRMITLNTEINRLKKQNKSDKEIMKELGIAENKYYDTLYLGNIMSLDSSIKNNKNTEEFEIQEVYDIIPYIENFDSNLILEDFFNYIDKYVFNEKTKELHKEIYKEFILNKLIGNKLTQKDYAKKYNLSQTGISRIIKKYNDRLIKFFD